MKGFWIGKPFLRLNSVNSSVAFFFQIGIKRSRICQHKAQDLIFIKKEYRPHRENSTNQIFLE
jgi:hypothetical protein